MELKVPEFNVVVRLRFQQTKGRDGFTVIVEANKGDPDEKNALEVMELLRKQFGKSVVECFSRNTETCDRVDMMRVR